MVKAHLKRLTVPRTWPIDRKETVFTAKPAAGKDRELSISLIVAVRDMLKMCTNQRELIAMLREKNILVNGVPAKSQRLPVGLFDVITFSKSKQSYRLILNRHGRFLFVQDKAVTIGKIKNKKQIKGKTQLNLLNGVNLFIEKDDFKVGDSVVYEEGKVKDTLPLAKGAYILLIGGRHIGLTGTVENIEGRVLHVKTNDDVIETRRMYAYVVGKTKPVIACEYDESK